MFVGGWLGFGIDVSVGAGCGFGENEIEGVGIGTGVTNDGVTPGDGPGIGVVDGGVSSGIGVSNGGHWKSPSITLHGGGGSHPLLASLQPSGQQICPVPQHCLSLQQFVVVLQHVAPQHVCPFPQQCPSAHTLTGGCLHCPVAWQHC